MVEVLLDAEVSELERLERLFEDIFSEIIGPNGNEVEFDIQTYRMNLDELKQGLDTLMNAYIGRISPIFLLTGSVILYQSYFKTGNLAITYYTPKVLHYYALKELSRPESQDRSGVIDNNSISLIVRIANLIVRVFELSKFEENMSFFKEFYPLFMLKMNLRCRKLTPFQRNDLPLEQLRISNLVVEQSQEFLEMVHNKLLEFNILDYFGGCSPNTTVKLLNFFNKEPSASCFLHLDFVNIKSIYTFLSLEFLQSHADILDNDPFNEYFQYLFHLALEEVFPDLYKNSRDRMSTNQYDIYGYLEHDGPFSTLYLGSNQYFTSQDILNSYWDEVQRKVLEMSHDTVLLGRLERDQKKQICRLSEEYNKLHEKHICERLKTSSVFEDSLLWRSDISKGTHSGWVSRRQVDYIVLFKDPNSERYFIGVGEVKSHKRGQNPIDHYLSHCERYPREVTDKFNITVEDIISAFPQFCHFLQSEMTSSLQGDVTDLATILDPSRIVKLLTIFPDTLYVYEGDLIFVNEWTSRGLFYADLTFTLNNVRDSSEEDGHYYLYLFQEEQWRVLHKSMDWTIIRERIDQLITDGMNELFENELLKVVRKRML